MRVPRPISLNPEQRKILEQQARSRSLPARQVERAQIVLRAAAGSLDKYIAAELGITPPIPYGQMGGVLSERKALLAMPQGVLCLYLVGALFHGFHPRFTLLIQCRLDLLLSLKPVIPI